MTRKIIVVCVLLILVVPQAVTGLMVARDRRLEDELPDLVPVSK